MRVNVISESDFTVQGHGVHSAYRDMVSLLKQYTDFEVTENAWGAADIIHCHTAGPYALVKMVASTNGVKVVTAHVTPSSFIGSLAFARYWRRVAAWYLRSFYNLADAVFAVSPEVEQELRDMGVSRQIYVVPNVIEVDAFARQDSLRRSMRSKLKLIDGQYMVLGCGQLQPRKRLDTFVAVARKLPNVEFVWVGATLFKGIADHASGMKKLVREAPSNVRFVGSASRDVVKAYYSAADIFFLPSAQETFGLVIVEAAAAGLPLVLRDLSQYRDTFHSGYIAGNDSTFADKIVTLTTNDNIYHERSEAALALARSFDARHVALQFRLIYSDLLSRKVKSTA